MAAISYRKMRKPLLLSFKAVRRNAGQQNSKTWSQDQAHLMHNGKLLPKLNPKLSRRPKKIFIRKANYDPVVARIKRATGYDLDNARQAVREVTFSVVTQHGGAAKVLADAIKRTDQRLKRTDPNYQRVLIDNI